MGNRPGRRLLHELAVFEAAARAAGFSAAGRDLGMTQSAVSHHVAHLERALGATLFRRIWRGVTLTDAGAALYEAVRHGFSTIDAAVDAIRAEGRRPHLTVVTDFGFAAFWLLPRLDALKAIIGGRDVHIVTTQSSADVDLATGDAAIAFGAGVRPGFVATRLVDEEVVPVAGLSFQARQPLPALTATPLLHLDMPGAGRWLNWADYFAAQGWGAPAPAGGIVFNNYPLLIQAAIAGQGLALGWRPLVDELIARALVLPVGPSVTVGSRGYDLIVDQARARDPATLEQFRRWLLAEFKQRG